MTDDKEPALTDLEAAIVAQLRGLRQSAGLSQARLAREMAARGWRWHQQTVGAVEAGRRPLRPGELADLAALFGITPGSLFAGNAAEAAEAARNAAEQAARERLIAELASGSGHAA